MTRPGVRAADGSGELLLPQSVPTITSFTLLVLGRERACRVLLGIVGDGGIGMEFTQQLRIFEYGDVLTIALVVLVGVVTLDHAVSYLRKKLT